MCSRKGPKKKTTNPADLKLASETLNRLVGSCLVGHLGPRTTTYNHVFLLTWASRQLCRSRDILSQAPRSIPPNELMFGFLSLSL